MGNSEPLQSARDGGALSPADLDLAKMLRMSGVTDRAIARGLGCSASTIWRNLGPRPVLAHDPGDAPAPIGTSQAAQAERLAYRALARAVRTAEDENLSLLEAGAEWAECRESAYRCLRVRGAMNFLREDE